MRLSSIVTSCVAMTSRLTACVLGGMVVTGLVATGLVATGCSGRGAESPASRPYTGPLVESTALVPDFLWQQEITASRGPFSHSFPAALQSSEGVLTVLGLTPFRTRAFLIEQRGREFEYTQFVETKLPLRPAWVLIDIHRTFFDGLAPSAVRGAEVEGSPARAAPNARAAVGGTATPRDTATSKSTAAPRDGLRETLTEGELRRDTWQGGKLLRRTYERIDAPGDLITIDYGSGYRWGEPPPRIVFDNGWYGYRLEVVTISAVSLTEASGAEDVPVPSSTPPGVDQ